MYKCKFCLDTGIYPVSTEEDQDWITCEHCVQPIISEAEKKYLERSKS